MGRELALGDPETAKRHPRGAQEVPGGLQEAHKRRQICSRISRDLKRHPKGPCLDIQAPWRDTPSATRQQ
eukprot:963026-Pyramimonas_sp.AAC.1